MKSKLFRTILIVVGSISAFIISYKAYDYFFVYHVEMNGDNIIKSNFKDTFDDPGVTVRFRGKKFKNYKVHSDINVNKEGKYFVDYLIGKKKITREVDIEDIKGPNILLNGGNLYLLSYNKEYEEPGFKAIDNTDGDVTELVTVNGDVDSSKLGEYKITYEVEDSKKNKSVVERVVKVVDDELPIISFKNPLYMFSIKGKKLDLNDYTAIDNYDGDITKNVKVDGEVDINNNGVYEIKYSVSDSNGNKTVETRKVMIQPKNTKGIPVLMYHWFYDDTKGEKAGTSNTHNYISKTHLTEQLKFLKDEGFYFPTWKELNDYIDRKIDLPEKSVIITDDDCVKSFFDIALPVFQEYEVPVTSFCITYKKTWLDYKDAPYLEFQSHTNNLHVRKCKDTKWDGAVMCTDYETIYKDIQTSVNKIGSSYVFAYPFGHYNDDTIQALKDNNVVLAFTINSGRVTKGANKYKLKRVRISKDTSIEKYKKLLSN